jgi:exosortase E/protease (VPEID-CTERM system)
VASSSSSVSADSAPFNAVAETVVCVLHSQIVQRFAQRPAGAAVIPRADGSDWRTWQRRQLALRWVCLGVLLLAEWLLLGWRFETPLAPPGWWATLLEIATTVMPLAVTVATAAALLWAEPLWRQLHAAAGENLAPHRAWPFLGAHVLAFVVLYRLTVFVLEGNLAESAMPGVWAALWVASGVASTGLLIPAALPVRTLPRLARRTGGWLLAAAAIGAAAMAAGDLTRHGWRPLGRLTFWVVNGLIRTVAADPVVKPAQMMIGTQRFAVEISSQCSGYEGIGLIWVFLTAYLFLRRKALRFPRALLLLAIGTVAVWIGNIMRIAGLIAIGTWWSPAIALGGFHSYTGSLLFCGTALGLVAVAQRSRFFALAQAPAEDVKVTNPTAAYLGPLLALMVATMVTGALSAGGFDALYPCRVVAVAAVLWRCRRAYSELRRDWSWTAVGVGCGVFALWMALESLRTGTGAEAALPAALAGWPTGWAATWLAFRVVGSVLTVPVAEELAFRGYLLRRLVATDFERVPLQQFSWLAFVASSVLFGAMHQRLVAGTLAGAAYALVAYRRGALGDAVLAHATTNALIAGWVLTTGAWSLWV